MGETTDAARRARTLLLTRPEPQSHAFLQSLEERAGPIPHVISPLAAVRATGASIPDRGILIVTSGRAVEAAGPALSGRTVLCVGPATADLARQAGAIVHVCAATAEDLAALPTLPEGDLVHLCGDLVTPDLARGLAIQDRKISQVPIYETAVLSLSDAARSCLQSPGRVLAPVFSTASAERLAHAVMDLGHVDAELDLVAISAAAGKPVEGLGKLFLSAQPDGLSMQDAVLQVWSDLP